MCMTAIPSQQPSLTLLTIKGKLGDNYRNVGDFSNQTCCCHVHRASSIRNVGADYKNYNNATILITFASETATEHDLQLQQSITCNIPIPSSSIFPFDETCSRVRPFADFFHSGNCFISWRLKDTLPFGTVELQINWSIHISLRP